MSEFLQFLISGLAGGGTTALIALGLVVLFGPTRVLSFAQGSLISVAGVVLWLVTARFAFTQSIPLTFRFLIAAGLAVVIVAALGVFFQYAVINRAIGQPVFNLAILTIGLSTVIDTLVNGKLPATINLIQSPLSNGTKTILGATIADSELWTIAIVLVLVAVFFLFYRFSKVGLAIRAAAVDTEAAAVLGVSLPRLFAMAWMISGLFAVAAAVAILSGPGVGLTTGFSALTLTAFPAVILGGFDLRGTVLAAFLIGLIGAFFQFYAPTFLGENFYTVAPFVAMVAILLVRPQGLFGHVEVERV